jgi:hypothetical protein
MVARVLLQTPERGQRLAVETLLLLLIALTALLRWVVVAVAQLSHQAQRVLVVLVVVEVNRQL